MFMTSYGPQETGRWVKLLWQYHVRFYVRMLTGSEPFTHVKYYLEDPDRHQVSCGQHGAHLGPVILRWAPCWHHEPCYQGCHFVKWWSVLAVTPERPIILRSVSKYVVIVGTMSVYVLVQLCVVKFVNIVSDKVSKYISMDLHSKS